MVWSRAQRERLVFERGLLSLYFPSLQWVDPTGRASVVGALRTNAGRVYTLKLVLPRDFPASQPSAYIVGPGMLPSRGYAMNSASAKMHTLEPDAAGNVQVCHYHPELWGEHVTLYKVALKIRLWLEGYEGHLRSGLPIDHFLTHMNPLGSTP